MAVLAHKVVKLALGAYDALEGAEALQVCPAHVGDDGIVGLDDVDECAYVAGMRGPHLHYGEVVLGAEAQQCLRHADVVVEVALREEHVVFLLQHGGGKLLCCGLAVGAGDAYDARAELAAVMARELLQGGEAVVDEDAARVGGKLLLVHHGVGAALLQRHCGKAVAVERRALEREEQ